MVLNAMLDPFIAHFNHAHLEASPSQQLADATDVNGYTRTHTVLIAAMLMPGVTLGQHALEGVGPFVEHVNHAHLEESPSQQVADILDINGYVRTHTVLFKDVADPALSSATGSYGC